MKNRVPLIVLAAAVAFGISGTARVFSADNGSAPLDRNVLPPIGAAPTLHVPAWTRQTLSNGAALIVIERHDLPLVTFAITFVGGANQYEPAKLQGLAGITSQMMYEGTTTKTGDQLSDALQLLGINVGVSIGSEGGAIAFTSTTKKFEPALALLTEIMLHPSFPEASLERIRARTLVNLTMAKNQANAIAGDVFPKVIYGSDHPYGMRTTPESVKAITRDDIIALHQAFFQPGHAIVTVCGDVDPKTIKATVESALAQWPKGGQMPTFTYPKLPGLKPTTIYLVDKPGAAQSIVMIGLPGPARDTPDFFALQVMNRILGGQFSSRLNYNIREVHGYSYGVNSRFSFGKGPGAFRAGGSIVSDKTDAALTEFMKELRGIDGDRPITDEELRSAKEGMVQELPGYFSSTAAVGDAITNLAVQHLPDDYYQNYAKNIAAVTKEDIVRVAKKYIDMDHLAIVIVGDRASIEGPLKALNVAPLSTLDIEGEPAK